MVADSDKTDQTGDGSDISTTSSSTSSLPADLLDIISSVKKDFRKLSLQPTKPKAAILPPEVGYDYNQFF